MRIVKSTDCYSAQIEAYGPCFRYGYTSWVILSESFWERTRNAVKARMSRMDRVLFNLFPRLSINSHSGQCDQVWIFRLRWVGVKMGWKTVGGARPGLMSYSEAGFNLFVKWLPRGQRRVLPIGARG